MTTWFSATAVVPELTQRWSLGPGVVAWLTNLVRLNFVIGAPRLEPLNLVDASGLNRPMAAAALLALRFGSSR
ncbi:MAG: hypothetical protein U1E59_06355 [Amaricoccus sp.]